MVKCQMHVRCSKDNWNFFGNGGEGNLLLCSCRINRVVQEKLKLTKKEIKNFEPYKIQTHNQTNIHTISWI